MDFNYLATRLQGMWIKIEKYLLKNFITIKIKEICNDITIRHFVTLSCQGDLFQATDKLLLK